MCPDSDKNHEYREAGARGLENGNAHVGPEERCRATREPAQLPTKVRLPTAYGQCENRQQVAKELDFQGETWGHPFPYGTLEKSGQKKKIQYEARYGHSK
jgi:hypothetical protein